MAQLTDGDHPLPCGATLTVRDGQPAEVRLGKVDLDTALYEAEEVTGIWIEHSRAIESDHYEVEPLGDQPTHWFDGNKGGRRLVRLVEMGISGGMGDHTYDGTYVTALGRGEHLEGEDAGGWPPFLGAGTWRDGWTGEPIPGARIEPLARVVPS